MARSQTPSQLHAWQTKCNTTTASLQVFSYFRQGECWTEGVQRSWPIHAPSVLYLPRTKIKSYDGVVTQQLRCHPCSCSREASRALSLQGEVRGSSRQAQLSVQTISNGRIMTIYLRTHKVRLIPTRTGWL